MNELNQKIDVNQVLNDIKEEARNPRIPAKKVIKSLYELRTKEKFQQLSDSEFFDIVGETFKLDPDFFMNSVYPKMMSWNFPSFLSVREEVITLLDKLRKDLISSKPVQDDTSIKFIKE